MPVRIPGPTTVSVTSYRWSARSSGSPGRLVLVPAPAVLHIDVEERVARLRHVLELEPVAEVRRVLREQAVAEERKDGAVLALEGKLELRLELVQFVDVRHQR